jgi:hypothetical protein
VPYYPYADSAAGPKHKYFINTWYRRLVAEYSGLNFFQVGELDYIQYLAWRRDAFIYRMNQTQDGQEYLDNAWRMEQTVPDRPALREKIRKETPADGK